MSMRLAYNASYKCCGVRIGADIVTEDDLVGMSILITQKCSRDTLAQMVAFLEDAPDDLNFKRSAFFYARFKMEHFLLKLRNVENMQKWDDAIMALVVDMRLNPIE